MDRCETTGFRDHRYRPCRLDYVLSARCNGAGDHLEVHCKTCPALASSTAWCCRSATVAASSRPKPSRSRSTLSEIHASMHTSTPHPHIPTSTHPHIHMYKRSSSGAMLRGRSSARKAASLASRPAKTIPMRVPSSLGSRPRLLVWRYDLSVSF